MAGADSKAAKSRASAVAFCDAGNVPPAARENTHTTAATATAVIVV